MTLERLAQRCGAPLIPEVRTALQAWLDSLPPISSFFTILHLFYIEQRLGCWAGVTPYGEAQSTFDVFPYSHRRIIELMLSLPVNYKRERRFWKDVVEREWPDLLLFPVNPRSRFEMWEERTRLGLTRVASGLRNPKATIGGSPAAGRLDIWPPPHVLRARGGRPGFWGSVVEGVAILTPCAHWGHA